MKTRRSFTAAFCFLGAFLVAAQTVPLVAESDSSLYRSNEALVTNHKLSGLVEEDLTAPGKLKAGPAATTPLLRQYAASVSKLTLEIRQKQGAILTNFFPSEREAQYRWEEERRNLQIISCQSDAEVQSRVVVEMAKVFFERKLHNPPDCIWHKGAALVKSDTIGIVVSKSPSGVNAPDLQIELLPEGQGRSSTHGRLLAKEPVAVLANPLCPVLSQVDPLPLQTLVDILQGKKMIKPGRAFKAYVVDSVMVGLRGKLGAGGSEISTEAGEIDRLVFGDKSAIAIVPWGRVMNSDNHLLRIVDSTESWPTPLTVASGRYPLILELWCRLESDADLATSFAAFLASEETRATWIKLGYLKAPQTP